MDFMEYSYPQKLLNYIPYSRNVWWIISDLQTKLVVAINNFGRSFHLPNFFANIFIHSLSSNIVAAKLSRYTVYIALKLYATKYKPTKLSKLPKTMKIIHMVNETKLMIPYVVHNTKTKPYACVTGSTNSPLP